MKKGLLLLALAGLLLGGCIEFAGGEEAPLEEVVEREAQGLPDSGEEAVDFVAEESVAQKPFWRETMLQGEGLPGVEAELMVDVAVLGDWVYFRHPVEAGVPEVYALFRQREDGSGLTQVNARSCGEYIVRDGWIYYADFPYVGEDHGDLFRLAVDGGEPLLLAEELHAWQMEEGYLYYIHSYDTVGVGKEGHALYRMDLDGGNLMIAAYETVGPGVGGGHWDFRVADGYAWVGNLRITMGEPADGLEEVVVVGPVEGGPNDGWIYYSSGRLLKSRPDGSELTVLDGDGDSWYTVYAVDDGWVYYGEQGRGLYYRIGKDGEGKEEIERQAGW